MSIYDAVRVSELENPLTPNRNNPLLVSFGSAISPTESFNGDQLLEGAVSLLWTDSGCSQRLLKI
jgi:hypothetical protein